MARSLDLSAADVGILTSATALARLICNYPASLFAERVGRRPLLIAGPPVSADFVQLADATATRQERSDRNIGGIAVVAGKSRRPPTI